MDIKLTNKKDIKIAYLPLVWDIDYWNSYLKQYEEGLLEYTEDEYKKVKTELNEFKEFYTNILSI